MTPRGRCPGRRWACAGARAGAARGCAGVMATQRGEAGAPGRSVPAGATCELWCWQPLSGSEAPSAPAGPQAGPRRRVSGLGVSVELSAGAASCGRAGFPRRLSAYTWRLRRFRQLVVGGTPVLAAGGPIHLIYQGSSWSWLPLPAAVSGAPALLMPRRGLQACCGCRHGNITGASNSSETWRRYRKIVVIPKIMPCVVNAWHFREIILGDNSA